jgi:hypothetical protein
MFVLITDDADYVFREGLVLSSAEPFDLKKVVPSMIIII